MSEVLSVLHLGMPKCGSSALQTTLCGRPVVAKLDEPRKVFEYCVLTDEGRLLRGPSLQRSASLNPVGYEASDPFEQLSRMSSPRVASVASEFMQMHLAGHIPVMSCENWYHPDEARIAKDLLKEVGLAPVALLLVRPPVDWLNSLWFQQGLWDDSVPDVDAFLDAYLASARLDQVLDEWSLTVGPENLHVRLASGGSVRSFCETFGVVVIEEPDMNRSLPAALIEFMRSEPSVRPGRDTADLKWALDRMGFSSSLPGPWAFTQQQASRVLDAWRPGVDRLLGRLPPAERDIVADDARWWSSSAYGEDSYGGYRIAAAPRQLTVSELRQLLLDVLESLAAESARGRRQASSVALEVELGRLLSQDLD